MKNKKRKKKNFQMLKVQSLARTRSIPVLISGGEGSWP